MIHFIFTLTLPRESLYRLDAQVVVKEGPRKGGYRDCGLFAITTATLLAHGSDPTCYVFEQPPMRKHLLQCFENLKLCPFPTQSTLRPGWITSPLPVRRHLIQHMGIDIDQKTLFCIVHIFYKLI